MLFDADTQIYSTLEILCIHLLTACTLMGERKTNGFGAQNGSRMHVQLKIYTFGCSLRFRNYVYFYKYKLYIVGLQVLTRAAVDRGSRDNVTVVVVDLSRGGSESDGLTTAATAMDDVMGAVRAVRNVE